MTISLIDKIMTTKQ